MVEFSGFSQRGDPDLGTDVLIPRFGTRTVNLPNQPVDTTIARFLVATEDLVRDSAFIVARAIDPEGNEAADTISVRLGAPEVQLFNLDDGGTRTAGLSLAILAEANDPEGVTRIQVDISGAFQETLLVQANPARATLTLDTAVVIPASARGPIQIVASAVNSAGIEGASDPVSLNVGVGGTGDPVPPSVGMSASSPTRLEITDPVTVSITGSDDSQGSGLVSLGYTVLAISPERGDTVTFSEQTLYLPPRTGTTSATFGFDPFNVDLLSLPDTLVFEVTGFAVDNAGNCSASVGDPGLATLACSTGTGGAIGAADRVGQRLNRVVVAGRTVTVPAGGVIMDAAVDTIRRNLLMSNITRDQVEVFRIQEERFLPPVPVGSEPWGLGLVRSFGQDTLLVGNSGGTNISRVYLGPAQDLDPPFTPFEVANKRILTPDVVLFDIEFKVDDFGFLRYRVFPIPQTEGPGFSDRPQFLAPDSTGRILYSTKTTPIGELGTIRKAYIPPGGNRTEVRLFYEHGRLTEAEDFFAVANADNATAVAGGQGDQMIFTDHIPGFFIPANGGPAEAVAAATAANAAGSDIQIFGGRWDVPSIGFSDTTFVAASGDGGWVVFGEGAAQIGRIIMYEARHKENHGLAVSDVIEVMDLTNNASEQVRGVDLNHDGTLGVARGIDAYFFSTDLRLQGVADLPAGGAGAALHPLHANYPSFGPPGNQGYDPDTHLAFLGTGQGTIDIVDAFHFNRLGRIVIRDVMAGPLRAVLPFPEDNEGYACQTKTVFNSTGQPIGEAIDIFADALGNVPYAAEGSVTEDRCVVLKLFGVTTAGGVAVIDVRKSDILRDHPARQG